ncbi:MAG TPA: cytochrome c oxidase subunit 3 [Caulobacteraceae bacterium]|jgi:cytochrome c oxidase subunit 3|nr:cytochrome c oxidase subunit 3 [Caulobacteraceae bacterium]
MNGDLIVHEPYAGVEQQRAADYMGMYVFLGSEIMLFGGIFAALFAVRLLHPHAPFVAAAHLKIWLGTANTAILLTSSLFVAAATVVVREGRRRTASALLAVAVLCGVAFLCIKGVEYRIEYLDGLMPGIGPKQSPIRDAPAALIIDLYFISTVLHAIHLSVGVVLLGTLSVLLLRQDPAAPPSPITVVMAGLYWHLVDIVWIFLFPVLYLPRP